MKKIIKTDILEKIKKENPQLHEKIVERQKKLEKDKIVTK